MDLSPLLEKTQADPALVARIQKARASSDKAQVAGQGTDKGAKGKERGGSSAEKVVHGVVGNSNENGKERRKEGKGGEKKGGSKEEVEVDKRKDKEKRKEKSKKDGQDSAKAGKSKEARRKEAATGNVDEPRAVVECNGEKEGRVAARGKRDSAAVSFKAGSTATGEARGREGVEGNEGKEKTGKRGNKPLQEKTGGGSAKKARK